MPAEKDGPSPRSTTTRVVPGSASPIAASPCHRDGDIALRRSGRFSVIVATAPSTSSFSPASSGTGGWLAILGLLSAPVRRLRPRLVRPAPGRSALGRGLAPGGAAPAAQLHPGLAQHPVHKTVRSPGGRGQRTDALPRVIPALEVGRQLGTVRPGDPGALLQRLGHVYLPLGRVTAA